MPDLIPGWKSKLGALLVCVGPINAALIAFGLPHLSADQVQTITELGAALGIIGLRAAIGRQTPPGNPAAGEGDGA